VKNAIIRCVEEEYSPFWAFPRRYREDWRWLPFYLRGPAGGGPFTPLLTLVGIWRFARKPRRVADLPQEVWQDCLIVDSSSYLGSYGMGGPGFFGLKCRKGLRSFWIVFVLWGAAEWLTLDGKLLKSGLTESERELYEDRGVIAEETVHGGSLQSIDFTADYVTLTVRKADAAHIFELRRDGTTLPPWRGSGEKKVFPSHESLKDAIIISRRARLWLED
jgi:hypothetical protein